MIIPFDGKRPQMDPSVYAHSSAQILGDVQMGADSSVWLNTVIRGDVNYIRIGSRTNVQDNSTIHVTGRLWPTIIGDEVTVGHGVILHGCTVGNRCLIGIGAIVLDGCEIGEDCMIGAGSLVTPRSSIPPRHLVLGHPARVVRPLDSREIEELKESAAIYVGHAQHFRSQDIE